MRYFVCFWVLLFFSACQKKQLVVQQSVAEKPLIKKEQLKKISLNLQELRVEEIQEKLTFKDELLLTVTVSVFEQDKLVNSVARTSFMKSVKKGQLVRLDSIRLPDIALKERQTLGVQVSLWEVDDYQQINQRISQVNQIGGLVQLPITLLEWSAVSNPLGWFLWGTRIGGFGFQWLSKYDANDVVGVSEVLWKFEEIPNGKIVRTKKEVFSKKGNRLTNFNYVLTYQIKSKEEFR